MRAKSLLAASVGLVLGLAATQAGAFSISYNGPVDIKFSGYTTELNSGYGSGTFGPSGVSAKETTWGIGFLASIKDPATNQIIWQSGDPNFGNETIGYMLYGVADGNIQKVGATSFEIYNQGCLGGPCDGKIHIDFYLNPPGVNFATTPTSTRRGFSSFPGITNGTPLMQWELVPGIVSDDQPNNGTDTNPGYQEQLNTTLFQSTRSATLPTTGDGNFYANCVGGACYHFDTNGFTTSLDTLADFFGSFTIRTTSGAILNRGWQAKTEDPIAANVVSEPASLALLGASLLGLITWRRRGHGAA